MITTIVNILLKIVGWFIARDKSNAEAKAAFLLFVEQMQSQKLISLNLSSQDKHMAMVLKARYEKLRQIKKEKIVKSGAVQMHDKVVIRGNILKCTAITNKKPPWKYVFEIINK